MTSRKLLAISLSLILAGLMLAVFVGLTRLGMVISLLGLIAAGAAAMAVYVEWENGE